MTNAPGVMLGLGLSVLALGALIRQYGVPAGKWVKEYGSWVKVKVDSLETEIVAWKTIQSEANTRLRSVEGQVSEAMKSIDNHMKQLTDAIRGGK